MEDLKSKVTSLKEKGNIALQEGRFTEAIIKYTTAINLDNTNHLLYSNRSAAYVKSECYYDALEDADKTIKLKPDWAKGYSRKGSALAYLGRYEEAVEAYQKGLQLDPDNEQIKNSLTEIKARKAANTPAVTPEMYRELMRDPRTRKFLTNPEYKKILQELEKDPRNLDAKLKDPAFLNTFGTLFNMDNNSEELEKRQKTRDAEKETPKSELSCKKKRALDEKKLGNDDYKKKNFEEAIQHYNTAVELDPTEMIYLLNLAAVYFEQKEYHKCIAQCEKAIELGRENKADFKLIAKAFTRIGHSYKKMENWKQAKVYYEKSISEHRTPEIKTFLSDVEKIIKDEERKAYIDPTKAEEEKLLGNQKYRDGDYSGALSHYNEAILRNPEEPTYYSNRAICYSKLAAFDLSLQDCNTHLKLDPNNVRGWIRKGRILQALKRPTQALEAYQKALEMEPRNSEAVDGYRSCIMSAHSDPEEVRKRAMADPEIQGILRDPAMRMILEQMQNDPKAIMEHMKNPEISAKLQKLLESGLIAIL